MGGGLNLTAIAIFVVFVAASLFVTYWAANRTKSTGDFYTAGAKITGFQNGLALAGDFMSAATFLGLSGLIFIGGTDAMLFTVGIAVGWALILFVFADRLRNLGKYTFADAVVFRLQPAKLRILAAAGTLTVAIPYLIAQMVGAGSLIETLFGLPYIAAVAIVGTLMTVYVVFGGMLATTWVQVIKAVLLLGGGTVLLLLTLSQFDFNIGAMLQRAVEVHPRGADVLKPGLMFNDPISIISLALAFLLGTAGLPHVLMRFFTVPDAQPTTFLGLSGLIFIGGTDAMLFTVGIVVGWALILFVFADRLRNLGKYTFADAVVFRLQPEKLRILAAVGTLTVANTNKINAIAGK